MQVNREKLKERIRECRKKAELTQEELADRLHVKRQIISYYESLDSERTPNIDILATMADLFKTTTDYLLGLTDVASRDVELRKISDYTGLNENALSLAHYFKEQCDLNQENKALFYVMGAYFDVINFTMNIKQYDFNFITFLGRYKLILKEQTEKLKELTNSYLECLKNNTYHNEPSYLLEENEAIQEKVGYKKYLIEDGFKKFIDEYARDELELYKTALESLKSVLDEYDYFYYKEVLNNAHNNEAE